VRQKSVVVGVFLFRHEEASKKRCVFFHRRSSRSFFLNFLALLPIYPSSRSYVVVKLDRFRGETFGNFYPVSTTEETISAETRKIYSQKKTRNISRMKGGKIIAGQNMAFCLEFHHDRWDIIFPRADAQSS